MWFRAVSLRFEEEITFLLWIEYHCGLRLYSITIVAIFMGELGTGNKGL